MEKKKKHGVVVSGGGAWGAFGAGTLAGLNKKYDVGAGISTGALMTPLVVLGEYDRLKEGYTNTKDSDIFDLAWYKPRPIKKNGKVNIWAIIYSLLLAKETFGTTYAMRKHIDKFLHDDDFNRINSENREVFVGAQNLAEKPSLLHYFSTKYNNSKNFKDWMWASANAPFATSLIKKEFFSDKSGQIQMGQWTDGGLTEVVPFDPILKANCDEIDVIIHRTLPYLDVDSGFAENLIDNVDISLNAMRYDIEFEYLVPKMFHIALEREIKINAYFLPRKLSNNSLVFNKQQMTEWWNEAEQSIKNDGSVILNREDMKKMVAENKANIFNLTNRITTFDGTK